MCCTVCKLGASMCLHWPWPETTMWGSIFSQMKPLYIANKRPFKQGCNSRDMKKKKKDNSCFMNKMLFHYLLHSIKKGDIIFEVKLVGAVTNNVEWCFNSWRFMTWYARNWKRCYWRKQPWGGGGDIAVNVLFCVCVCVCVCVVRRIHSKEKWMLLTNNTARL